MQETRRIHIGNQTAVSAPLMRPFEYALESRFDAFEWFPDRSDSGAGWDIRDLDDSARHRIREAAAFGGMRVSVHAPWRSNPLLPGALGSVLESLELARDTGAALLNVHLEPAQGISAYVRAVQPVIERLPEFGLQLSIENTPRTTPEHFNELFSRLHEGRTRGAEHVGMCLDLGHANLCSTSRNDYLKFIDLLETNVSIIHFHLHENWGDYDSHLPIFTGPAARDPSGILGTLSRLEKRGFSGSIIMEQWPHPVTLLDEARDKLLRILDQHGRIPTVAGLARGEFNARRNEECDRAKLGTLTTRGGQSVCGW